MPSPHRWSSSRRRSRRDLARRNSTFRRTPKARQVTLFARWREVAQRTVSWTGAYTLESASILQGTSMEIRVDQTFTAPGDQRALGMVLNESASRVGDFSSRSNGQPTPISHASAFKGRHCPSSAGNHSVPILARKPHLQTEEHHRNLHLTTVAWRYWRGRRRSR